MYDNKSEYEIGIDKLFTDYYKYTIGMDVVNKNILNSKFGNGIILVVLYESNIGIYSILY